ncbi:unnamed protein product [Urochloa humidicola]
MALLPDDVVAHVLRRLPPRDLAASRCVCRAWHAIVDARRLLRADLLPRSPAGILINFNNQRITELFSRPASTAVSSVVSGKRHYLPDAESRSWGHVRDHCNGLLLVRSNGSDFRLLYVLNPATRWVAPLPPCPSPPTEMDAYGVEHLVYDPAVSPDYEVVSVPRFYRKYDGSRDKGDPSIEQSEWPPSVLILQVFSSITGQWEEKSFAREGEAVGTIADMRRHWRRTGYEWNAVYWRGALHVLCQTDYVMRISLSNHKYHVIKPSTVIIGDYSELYLGRSAKGVYLASIKGRCRVQVWNLNESEMEWVLKHDKDLYKWLLKHKLEYARPNEYYGKKIQGPWTLQDINYHYKDHDKDVNLEASVEENSEWSSQASVDDEIFASSSDDECGGYGGYLDILGFHPCQEIIFLSESITRGLAYNWNTLKVEVLGNIYPEGYDDDQLSNEQLIESSFPYTPCWQG